MSSDGVLPPVPRPPPRRPMRMPPSPRYHDSQPPKCDPAHRTCPKAHHGERPAGHPATDGGRAADNSADRDRSPPGELVMHRGLDPTDRQATWQRRRPASPPDFRRPTCTSSSSRRMRPAFPPLSRPSRVTLRPCDMDCFTGSPAIAGDENFRFALGGDTPKETKFPAFE